MDPQEKATSRNPLSARDNAVGAVSPCVSYFIGVLLSFLSSLKRPSDVEKKKDWASSGLNSMSRL